MAWAFLKASEELGSTPPGQVPVSASFVLICAVVTPFLTLVSVQFIERQGSLVKTPWAGSQDGLDLEVLSVGFRLFT